MSRIDAPDLPLYEVPRVCKLCGSRWKGQSFTPIVDGESLPRAGVCDRCVAADERRQDALTRRAPPVPQPTPKQAVRLPRDPDDMQAPNYWWQDR